MLFKVKSIKLCYLVIYIQLRSRQLEDTDLSFLFKFSQAFLDLLMLGMTTPRSQKLLKANLEAPVLAGQLGDLRQSRQRSVKPSTVWLTSKCRYTLAHINCTLLWTHTPGSNKKVIFLKVFKVTCWQSVVTPAWMLTQQNWVRNTSYKTMKRPKRLFRLFFCARQRMLVHNFC